MIVTEMLNTQDMTLTKKVIPGSEHLGERAGAIKSENYRPGESGFKISYDGDAEFNNGTFRGHIEAKSGYIGGVTIKGEEVTVQGRYFVPIGFIYFQLRGQPEPGTMFVGTWENISWLYQGLFFRVEGGKAAPFNTNVSVVPDQSQSIQSHNHELLTSAASGYSGGVNNGGGSTHSGLYTQNAGGDETRPDNTTIRVWKRTA